MRILGNHSLPLLRPVLAIVTTTALLAGTGSADADPSTPDPLQQRLDAVVDTGAVGALAVVRDGHERRRLTSGHAAIDTGRPVPVRSRFRIGSITKTFLATVVLQMVDEGRLRLSDPIEKWLPGLVPDGRRIKVRHLLDHTSGLYEFRLTLNLPPSPKFLRYRWRTWSLGEQIHRAVAHPPTSQDPGSVFAYSNTNYLVLARLVEKLTRHSYAHEIRSRILRPLRLRHTSLPGTSPRIPGPHPHGYAPVLRKDGLHLVDFTEMNPSLFGPSGEMISTAPDLQRFFTALLRGRLIPDRLLAKMKKAENDGDTYGLGLAWRDTTCGIRLFGNDGDALSYQSWSYATEDGSRNVTVMLTPDFSGDADDAVDAFIDEAICG
jgi:D-alanyl-D-alanine carboxypeptidase